ncbi:MAG TPA: pyruvate formate lyase family protein, partial [Gemmatimonadaceae bacterium]|nr:pyruvate formate lyase family protein [Gemmatimonadaceae bacterium]
MTPTTLPHTASPVEAQLAPWAGFTIGGWCTTVDVRDFIQRNYRPYTGDAGFLAPATERTQALWQKVLDLLAEERNRGGLLDVETVTPTSITAYGPGYIDKDLELVVGLQTDAPLKRGIYLYGGARTVEAALAENGRELDPITKRLFSGS